MKWRPHSRFLRYIPAAVALAVLWPCGSDAAETADRPMAWAHYVPWHLPQDVSLAAERYYNYPLLDAAPTIEQNFQREFELARRQGINGFFCDVVAKKNQPPVFGDTIEKMLHAAAGTGFQIGICLDVKITTEYQITEVARLLERFARHPNYPHYRGRPMVCTYTFLDWTPTEWQAIRRGLREKGWDIHLMANFATGYDRRGMERCDDYLPVLDSIYLFSLPGLNGVPVAETNQFYVRKTGEAGKFFLPCIYPGYYGAWLNGRNPFYIIHRHFDTAHETFLAAAEAPGRDLMYTTWNDHDETSLMPMLFTAGNAGITRAYTENRKGVPITWNRPELFLAAHRETPAGTLLRLEVLSLPLTGSAPIRVSGVLKSPEGKVAARLPERRLKPGTFDRAEWQLDSIPLARHPHLTPVLTVRRGNSFSVTRRFPSLFFITGYLKNAVTCKTALSDLADIQAELSVSADGENQLKVRHRFRADKEVRRATLFRNDRPLAVPEPERTLLPLLLTIPGGTFELEVESGLIRQAVRKFRLNGSADFQFDETRLVSRNNLNWMPIALRLAGAPETRLTIRHGGQKETVTFADIASGKTGGTRQVRLRPAALDATTQNDTPRLQREADETFLLLTRPPLPEDRFQMRYDFADGTFAWSEPVYPFAQPGSRRVNLLRTPINLETPSGPNGPHHGREFLSKPLFSTSTIVPTNVALPLRRRNIWRFDGDGREEFGELPEVPIPPELFAEGRHGRALHFTGREKIRMPLRTMPLGGCAISFALHPDAIGVKQSILAHEGDSEALVCNLLADGRLEILRIGREKPDILHSRTKLQSGRWRQIRIENHLDRLLLKIDGRRDAEISLAPLRLYGNSTWFLGGGYPGYESFRGSLDDLIVDSFP